MHGGTQRWAPVAMAALLPLTYEVDDLRGLLVGTYTAPVLELGVLRPCRPAEQSRITQAI